jgi:hypothetical protein
MTETMNETEGRNSEHEPGPRAEKIKCDQEQGQSVDIFLAKQNRDLTDKTCQDCRRCI